MVNSITPAGSGIIPPEPSSSKSKQQEISTGGVHKKDTVSFGQQKLSAAESQNIVYERAMEKLRGVVNQARADLNIPEGVIIDPSPDATAQRILGFALNFFNKYAEKHGLNDDEAGRQQFADFIGGAIGQGIDEARGILDALSALDSNVSSNIDKTAEAIQQGLNDFVKNGLQRTA